MFTVRSALSTVDRVGRCAEHCRRPASGFKLQKKSASRAQKKLIGDHR